MGGAREQHDAPTTTGSPRMSVCSAGLCCMLCILAMSPIRAEALAMWAPTAAAKCPTLRLQPAHMLN